MDENETPRAPYFPWYVLDYRASFRVQRLSWKARGLYREILDECWLTGHVPDNMDELALICRCDIKDIAEHWRYIKPLLRDVPGSGGALLESPRIERERAEMQAARLRRQAAGRKGGKSRNPKPLEAMLSNAKLSEQSRADQSRAVGVGALRQTANCTCEPTRDYAPGTGAVFLRHAEGCHAR